MCVRVCGCECLLSLGLSDPSQTCGAGIMGRKCRERGDQWVCNPAPPRLPQDSSLPSLAAGPWPGPDHPCSPLLPAHPPLPFWCILLPPLALLPHLPLDLRPSAPCKTEARPRLSPLPPTPGASIYFPSSETILPPLTCVADASTFLRLTVTRSCVTCLGRNQSWFCLQTMLP